MRKRSVGFLLAPLVMSLLMPVVSCSGKTGKASAEDRSTCEDSLGAAAISWVKDSAQGGELVFEGDGELGDARSLVYRQMRDWDPGREGKYLSFADFEICAVKERGREPGMGYLTLRYGPSIFPFKEISDHDGKMTKVSVNSDVVFVYGQWDLGNPSRYDVYFRCQIPGAPAEQKDGVPVVGEMVDTLTGETGARTRMKHLLHSAQVMARTLDCENDPVIPAEPPAAVK